MVRAVVHASCAAFLERARDYLRATVLENNVAAGVVHRFLRQPERYPGGMWCVTLEDAGRIVGLVLQTPPWPVWLSAIPDESIEAVASLLRGRSVPALVAPGPVARVLADHLGLKAICTIRQRLYAIREKPAAPCVPGRMTPMALEDRELGLAWLQGFDLEIGERRADNDRVRTLDLGIAAGQFHLWDDEGPACMATVIETPPEGCRIGAVFTPPERRRRGYAGALVTSLTRLMMEQGHPWCCLYTDLANPTSNSIYQKIGYRGVTDVVKLEF